MTGSDDLAAIGLPALVRELLRRKRQGRFACVTDDRTPATTVALGLSMGLLVDDGRSFLRGVRFYAPGDRAETWLRQEDRHRRLATTAKRSGEGL